MATLGAYSSHAHFDAGYFEVIFSAHLISELQAQRAGKFDYLSAVDAYQVLMFTRWLDLVVMMPLIEMPFLHQLQLFE
jgi:hypothetical protein